MIRNVLRCKHRAHGRGLLCWVQIRHNKTCNISSQVSKERTARLLPKKCSVIDAAVAIGAERIFLGRRESRDLLQEKVL